MFDIVLHNGKIIDGTGTPWFISDVGIRGDKITAVGKLSSAPAIQQVDVTGLVVAPGFVDAHVHGDLALFSDPYHEAAIRQGVTTYILGQDGVAMAPASAETLRYMRQYTAGFSGIHHIQQQWSSMEEYLACLDRRCALNVSCLIPNGNVRMNVMGLETRPPSANELRAMQRIVCEAMEQGAIGLSTGLDYIPSRYADTEEIIALCHAIAPYGGVYVTHMRRYDPEGVVESMEEVFRIGREANVPVHISHFNSQATRVLAKLDEARKLGIDVTFDLYCYLAGNTILGMYALPPSLQEGGIVQTIERLCKPETSAQLRTWFNQSGRPLDHVRLAFIASMEYNWLEGKTLSEACELANKRMEELVPELLVHSEMGVGCIAPHQGRGTADIEEMMRHHAMMAGSDGIFAGSAPHPRGYGCFARYLSFYVRDRRTWSLEEAVHHLSALPAARFGLYDRGVIRPGMAADIVVFNESAIADRATFVNGKQTAVGVEHVLVNGEFVLQNGTRTKALPGRALRRR